MPNEEETKFINMAQNLQKEVDALTARPEAEDKKTIALQKIENDFTYHAPAGDQAGRYEAIRESAKAFMKMLVDLCPESRELSLAKTNLEQAVFWANASIARNENPVK